MRNQKEIMEQCLMDGISSCDVILEQDEMCEELCYIHVLYEFDEDIMEILRFFYGANFSCTYLKNADDGFKEWETYLIESKIDTDCYMYIVFYIEERDRR